MKIVPVVGILSLALTACGGGGGNDGGTGGPPPPPPPPTVMDPVPSVFFSDASSSLPASRAAGCFDAEATDIDNDGDLDLLLAGFALAGAPNLLFRNDGAGSFTDVSANSLPANNNVSEHVASGDFDNDGDIDVVVANVNDDASEAHEYYLNTGNGGVLTAAPQGLPVAGLTAFVAARDFDGDNDLDLIFANFGFSDYLSNDGSGVFADESGARLPNSDPSITEDSGIGDVNGDGFLDIFIAYRGSQFAGEGLQNQLWINDGTGVFTDVTSAQVAPLINSTFDLHLADIDGDQDLDALFGNATIAASDEPIVDNLLINDGNGVFSDATAARWAQPSPSNTYSVETLDIDRDGDLDILVSDSRFQSGIGRVRAFENDGSGNFTEQTAALLGEVRGNVADLEVADFNADGLPDIYFCAASLSDSPGAARDFLFLAQ